VLTSCSYLDRAFAESSLMVGSEMRLMVVVGSLRDDAIRDDPMKHAIDFVRRDQSDHQSNSTTVR
jgi:hypothetical protein